MSNLYQKFLKHSRTVWRGYLDGLWRYAIAIAIPLLLGGTHPIFAQENPWIFGLYTRSNSVVTNDILGLADILVNSAVAEATDGAASSDFILYNYHYVKLEDNGETIDFKRNNPYGFTAYDLFNDIEAGIKLGWQGAQSPIGVYVYGAYGINQYKLRFLGERDYSKHKLQSYRVGVGVRISPLRFLLEDYEWCPIIELGTTYIGNFSYKGPNGSDRNQINNGMRSTFALGAQFGEEGNVSVMLCMDMAHYDIFNRDYTPDGGFWFPYANFKSKDMNFSLRVSLSLWDD